MTLSVEPRGGATGLKGRSRRLLRSNYADFLPQSQAVAEREAAPLARVLILVIALLFASFITWAAIVEVDQVATAPGVVRPAGKVKIINHPIGGRVAAILIKEGQRVKAGQILIEMDPEFTREEIAKLTGEWMSRAAQTARLQAEAAGSSPVFAPAIAAKRPDLVTTHSQLFDARRQSLAARRTTADRVVEQRAREVKGLVARQKQLARSLVILKEQESAVAELADKGYFPRLRFLSIRRQVSELEGQIDETREGGEAARAALAEAESRRGNIDKESRSEILSELTTARRERDRARSSLLQEMSRLRNLTIRAPISGIIQNVAITAQGQAIRANEALMNVVPTSAQLVVEARVSNDDIGHISPGQKTTVKIRTYDFVRFGTLEGVVEQIAADAVEDTETGQLTFNVTIRTERSYLGSGPGQQPVNPGMQAEVDFHIGRRSILSYLTDRLNRTSQTAFRER